MDAVFANVILHLTLVGITQVPLVLFFSSYLFYVIQTSYLFSSYLMIIEES